MTHMQQPPHPLTYKFVRYCVNKAYSRLIYGFNENDANILYSLETIINEIRYMGDEFKTIEDVVKFISGDFLNLYRRAVNTLKSDLASKIFQDILDNCLELDEVKEDRELVNLINRVKAEMGKIKPEKPVPEESS